MNRKYTGLAAVCIALLPYLSPAQVALKSIGVGAAYWQPSLNYWNTNSILTAYNGGKGAKLSGTVMPTAAIEIAISQGLSAGVRAGYWKQSAESALSIAGIDRTEKLTLSIIPVSLDLTYRFGKHTTETVKQTSAGGRTQDVQKTVQPSLVPYIGVGLSRYFVKNDYSRQVVNNTGSVTESQAGNNYGIQVFAGIEKQVVKMLYAALDVRYHVGSYNQVVRTDAATTTEKVSLFGLEAGLSLRVKLAN